MQIHTADDAPRRRRSIALIAAMAMTISLLPGVAAMAQDADEAEDWDNFEQEVLNEDVQEAMSLAVLPDGRVLHNARSGDPDEDTGTDAPFRLYDPDTGNSDIIFELPVYSFSEYGAQGFALDPDFEDNGWIYIYYTPDQPDIPDGEAPHDGEPGDWDEYQGVNQLSRFTFEDGEDGPSIDADSEEVMLEVSQNLGLCCHLGGDIDFDSEGNLFLSTGDDTSPFESDNYTPIDERETRNPGFDGQRTSANTASLSGKLLRITPQDDGSYTVPEDNMFNSGEYDDLFPDGEYDEELALPEIYAMGFRNPFRFTVDPVTDNVYLADYGPDAPEDDPDRGPEGRVTYHILTDPGRNAGWPYCHAGYPYMEFDFETEESGEPFDCEGGPVNESPHNTGLEPTPPVTDPELYYGFSGGQPGSHEGLEGGAPMGGPVYRYDADLDSDVKFPEFYDGTAFFYEWGMDHLSQFVLDESGEQVEEVRDFLPDWEFASPMDMEFGPDGAMYLLEYGQGFFGENEEAQLSRITYSDGEPDEGPGNEEEICPDVGVPADQISVQLWTFFQQADMGSAEGLEDLAAFLSSWGYRTIEPFGQPYDFIDAADQRELWAEHGIQVVSSHGDQDVDSFEDTVAYAAELGQDYIGAGSPPGDFDTWEETIEIADTLNTLGEMAVDGGIPGGMLLHNHEDEFLTEHEDPDDGEMKSVWQILMENTDPEHVTFQLDVYWAAVGEHDPVEVIETYGDRIKLLHMKDGNITDPDNHEQTDLGAGDLDVPAIVEAGWDHIDYYVVEADFPDDAYDYTAQAFEYLNCLDIDPQPSQDVTATLDPADPDGDNDWYVSPVTLTLESDDDTAELQWRYAGDEAWDTWTEPTVIDADGEHEIEYRAFWPADNGDDNGNGDENGDVDSDVEISATNFEFTPDEATIALGGTATFLHTAGSHNVVIWDNPDYDDSISAIDGIASTGDTLAESLDWETFEFTPESPGTYYFNCTPHGGMDGVLTVVDPDAGNGNGDGESSEVYSLEVNIDQAAPETSADVDGDPGVGGVYISDVSVSLEASDETSGVDSTEVRDGDEVVEYDGPIEFSGDGEYTIEFRSIDVAGNAEEWQQLTITIDSDAPPLVDGLVCEPHQGGATFPDAPGSGHRYFIDCLAELGIVQGYVDGSFGPANDVSRGQLATFVVNALKVAGYDELEVGDDRYPDVGINSEHGEAIYKLTNAEVLNGFTDGLFDPHASVSRQQAASYLAGAIELVTGENLPTSGNGVFPDVEPGSTHGENINKLATAGVIEGFTDGSYGPRESMTRGQMSSVVGRSLDVLNEAGVYAGP